MVKLLDTSRLPKPEDLQCDNLNYALTNEVSRHGVKVCVPSNSADDGGAARVSGRYPQFVLAHLTGVFREAIRSRSFIGWPSLKMVAVSALS